MRSGNIVSENSKQTSAGSTSEEVDSKEEEKKMKKADTASVRYFSLKPTATASSCALAEF